MKFKIKLESVYDQVEVNFLSDQKFKRLSKREFPEDEEPPLAFAKGSSLFYPQSSKTDIPLIVHQIIHGIKSIMQNKHIQDEQFLCYSTQFCLQKILKKLKIKI